MISYPLGASTLSEIQLRKIHLEIKKAYLAKAGLNRKFPKAVLRGPKKYGGHGDPSLYTRKGFQQLQLLCGHIRNKDKQGGMMRQEIEVSQLTAGIMRPILKEKGATDWMGWIEDTWVKDVKLFLTSIGAGVMIMQQ